MKKALWKKRALALLLTFSVSTGLSHFDRDLLPHANAESYAPVPAGQSCTIQSSRFSLRSDSVRIADATASDGSCISMNTDVDYPELFMANAYGTLSENTEPRGLHAVSYTHLTLPTNSRV